MAVIKQMVQCFVCTNNVLKSQTRLMDPFKQEEKYECFTCFKQNRLGKTPLQSGQNKVRSEKLDLFCSSCKYTFRSKRLSCPYCGKKDTILENKITTVDLLA